jgi:hypothetical protein
MPCGDINLAGFVAFRQNRINRGEVVARLCGWLNQPRLELNLASLR